MTHFALSQIVIWIVFQLPLHPDEIDDNITIITFSILTFSPDLCVKSPQSVTQNLRDSSSSSL